MASSVEQGNVDPRHQSLANEETPLLQLQKTQDLKASSEHKQRSWLGVSKHVTTWKSHRLATLQVFTFTTGTVLSHPVLWVEQFLTTLIFAVIVFAITAYRHPDYEKWANTTQGNIKSFTTMVAALTTFLLSFYVTLSINRWWDLRIQGIAKITDATSELNLYISRVVTTDDTVLRAIRRYARTSLLLIVLQHKPQEECLAALRKSQFLTEDEMDKLLRMNCATETIWTWITEIVAMLRQENQIKAEPMYCYLLGKCKEGRAAAARIAGTLSTPIPLIYVHLLSLMVKLHNFLLVILMAMVGANYYLSGSWLLFLQVVGRIFLMPLMYNAILLICEVLSDPFGGDLGNFPLEEYLEHLERSSESYTTAGNSLPEWMEKWEDPKKS